MLVTGDALKLRDWGGKVVANPPPQSQQGPCTHPSGLYSPHPPHHVDPDRWHHLQTAVRPLRTSARQLARPSRLRPSSYQPAALCTMTLWASALGVRLLRQLLASSSPRHPAPPQRSRWRCRCSRPHQFPTLMHRMVQHPCDTGPVQHTELVSMLQEPGQLARCSSAVQA